jgi:hypothetical protein
MKRILGLFAVAGLMLVAAPHQPAEAMSLNNLAGVTIAKQASEGITIEIRGRGGRRGGHFRGGRVFFGGPRFVVGPAYYAPRHFCRVVGTPYGPRRVCRPQPWW